MLCSFTIFETRGEGSAPLFFRTTDHPASRKLCRNTLQFALIAQVAHREGEMDPTNATCVEDSATHETLWLSIASK